MCSMRPCDKIAEMNSYIIPSDTPFSADYKILSLFELCDRLSALSLPARWNTPESEAAVKGTKRPLVSEIN